MTFSPTEAIRVFSGFRPFQDIIQYYVDLSCFLVIEGRVRDWWALNRRKRLNSFYSLEVKYRSDKARDRFIRDGLRLAAKSGRTALVDRVGFTDLFTPVRKGGRTVSFLESGAFARREVTRSIAEECWRKMTGLEPSPGLPGFREFLKILLEVPVLEGPVLPAFQECVELFAGVLGGSVEPESATERMREHFYDVFSKHMPHSYFMDWALGRPTGDSVPPWRRGMGRWPWVRREIGIDRVPTTVMAVVPLRSPGSRPDWTAERLRAYRFQRRGFRFAQTIPQTVGGALDDYGAVFVTSADEKLGRLARRGQIEETARRIRDFAEKEMGVPVRVGIGESVEPGRLLHRSYRQAVVALHLEAAGEKTFVLYDEGASARQQEGYALLRRQLDLLDRAYAESRTDLETFKEAYLRSVFNLAFQDFGEVRWHFLYALDRLAETVGSRAGLEPAEKEQLRNGLGKCLEEAANLQEVATAFREALSRLDATGSRPVLHKGALAMERVRDHVDRHFGEPMHVQALAQKAGVSAATFSRSFRKMTGKGFETYLQDRRFDEACRLLRSTSLPVAQVVRNCGFRSDSYFIRFFRKRTGQTPMAFRRETRRR